MARPVHVYVPPQFQAMVPGYGDQPAAAGRDVVFLPDEAAYRDELPAIAYLLTIAPPPGEWARGGDLRLVQAIGAGFDHLYPLDGLAPGCVIANSAGLNAEAVAETGLALATFLRKGYAALLDAQRERRWIAAVPPPLRGSTMAILGCGRIGGKLAAMAMALGMRVSGTWSRPAAVVDGVEMFPPEHSAALIAAADIVVSLLPATPETQGFLDAALLARFRPEAVFVNLGRGGVVDEDALAAMLRDGRLAGAAMDVFATEPLPPESPLWDCPRLIVSPHLAGAQEDHLARSLDLFLHNVAAIERGEPVPTAVDPARGY